jgi:hypothetical protein
MSRDLDNTAWNCLADALYDMDTFDAGELRERADDMAFSAAESACTYYSDCMDVIDRYERDAGSEVEDYNCGREFKAEDWRDAMTAYASAIAIVVIRAKVNEACDEIEEAADTLCDELREVGPDVEPEALRIGRDCPHGWAAHDREDSAGTHFWVSRQLDGCNALAVKAGGVWLSYTWTPEA